MRIFLVALLLLTPAPLLAQGKGQGKMGEKISASGTIKAIAPGALHVMSTEGDQWQVAIDPKAEVVVTGSATPSFLRAGMLVKFSGKFNKRAESVEPLPSLTVFTPRQPTRRQGEEPSADVSDLAKGLFKFDEPAAEEEKKKAPESFDVSSGGAIVSARGGKVAVRSPQGTFKITLADDAMVDLDVSDYRLARPGDKVEIEGWTYQGDVTKVVANRIAIRLAEPLGEKKKETKKAE